MGAVQYVDVMDDGFSGMVIDGIPRKLNLTAPKLKAMPRLEDTQDLIPESEWTTTDITAHLGDILPDHDQGSVGQCELCSEVEAVEFVRLVSGLSVVKLSPSFLYGMVNNGVDHGASIGDGEAILKQFGTCRDELCPTGRFYVRSQLTKEMYADARNYRALFAFHTPTFEEIVTARLRGFGVVHGVSVGATFNNLDGDGCYPPTRGFPNHAISVRDIRRRSNGEWYTWCRNHWSKKWGDDGRFGTSQAAYEAMGYQDAIAYCVVSIDADAPLPPMSQMVTSAPFFVNDPRYIPG